MCSVFILFVYVYVIVPQLNFKCMLISLGLWLCHLIIKVISNYISIICGIIISKNTMSFCVCTYYNSNWLIENEACLDCVTFRKQTFNDWMRVWAAGGQQRLRDNGWFQVLTYTYTSVSVSVCVGEGVKKIFIIKYIHVERYYFYTYT